jgi:hypothetical protein
MYTNVVINHNPNICISMETYWSWVVTWFLPTRQTHRYRYTPSYVTNTLSQSIPLDRNYSLHLMVFLNRCANWINRQSGSGNINHSMLTMQTTIQNRYWFMTQSQPWCSVVDSKCATAYLMSWLVCKSLCEAMKQHYMSMCPGNLRACLVGKPSLGFTKTLHIIDIVHANLQMLNSSCC